MAVDKSNSKFNLPHQKHIHDVSHWGQSSKDNEEVVVHSSTHTYKHQSDGGEQYNSLFVETFSTMVIQYTGVESLTLGEGCQASIKSGEI